MNVKAAKAAKNRMEAFPVTVMVSFRHFADMRVKCNHEDTKTRRTHEEEDIAAKHNAEDAQTHEKRFVDTPRKIDGRRSVSARRPA